MGPRHHPSSSESVPTDSSHDRPGDTRFFCCISAVSSCGCRGSSQHQAVSREVLTPISSLPSSSRRPSSGLAPPPRLATRTAGWTPTRLLWGERACSRILTPARSWGPWFAWRLSLPRACISNALSCFYSNPAVAHRPQSSTVPHRLPSGQPSRQSPALQRPPGSQPKPSSAEAMWKAMSCVSLPAENSASSIHARVKGKGSATRVQPLSAPSPRNHRK